MMKPFVGLFLIPNEDRILIQSYVEIPDGLWADWGGFGFWGDAYAISVNDFLSRGIDIITDDLSKFKDRDPRKSKMASAHPSMNIQDKIPFLLLEEINSGKVYVDFYTVDSIGPVRTKRVEIDFTTSTQSLSAMIYNMLKENSTPFPPGEKYLG